MVDVLEVIDPQQVRASLTRSGVVVHDPSASQVECAAPQVTFVDLWVGWLPG